MNPLGAFALILLVVFTVLILLLRPTQTEKALRERLKMIEDSSAPAPAEGEELLKEQALSDVPWLNDLLKQVPLFVALQRYIGQAGRKWPVAPLLLATIVLTVAGFWAATFWFSQLPLAAVIGCAVGSLPYLYLYRARASRMNHFEELLPDAIDLMSRGLRAGHTVPSAVAMVAEESAEPVASEFRRTYEENSFGLPFREAILNLAERVPLPDVRFLVMAVVVQRETGGNLADVLEKTTYLMRQRFRLKRQVRVYTAQGRLTAYILSALPFGCFLLLSIINPAYERVLITDPLGLKMVMVGIVMMVLGILIIRKIIRIKI
jgi:tight adherence protein B